jgi:hypothetical protein
MMTVKFKFPAVIFYTAKVSKGKGYVVQGLALGPLVIIGKFYKNDKGLLAHEMCHVKQFWCKGLIIHMLRYKLSRHYRLHSECKAYYEQWKAGEKTEIKKDDFKNRIWLFYNLGYRLEYVEKIFYSYFL